MGKAHRPRRGSLQFWPRKRAKKQTPRVKKWTAKESSILGFAGFKAGMTHIQVNSKDPKYGKGGEIVNHPVTVIECPPLKPLALRFYIIDDEKGLRVNGHLFTPKQSKELARKFTVPKKTENVPEAWDEVRLLVSTQPKLTGIGKKKPDVFEMHIKQSKDLEELKKFLGKDIAVADVFRAGDMLDVHGVTIGKGFQGTVKRFGVTIRSHKSEKTKRGIGNLGSWTPKRVSFRVPQAGKMGYHLRTEYNKQLMQINDDPKAVNPKGGFVRFGNVKNSFLLIDGSIPGPKKRLIMLTNALRPKVKKPQAPEVINISLESKQ